MNHDQGHSGPQGQRHRHSPPEAVVGTAIMRHHGSEDSTLPGAAAGCKGCLGEVPMHDEEALLLTVLDRPHEPAVRLVYADWLEDHGQDELAESLRLQATAPRAPAARYRLRELHERHRTEWVELG